MMMRNPVLSSAMKRRMRSFRAPMLLTLYIVFLLLVCAGAVTTLQADEVSVGSLRAGIETYLYLSLMQFALIILVAPALTAGTISGERERQTLDLLLCTRVGALRIVLGKLLSNVCFLALLIVSSLPLMAVTLFFGGVGVWDIVMMQLFLLVTALACCAIGVFCSALFRRTVTATVVAYLSIFAVGIGTIAIPFLLQVDQMQGMTQMIHNYTVVSSSGPAAVSSMGYMNVPAAMPSAWQLPKLLFINPAVGFFSLLVTQTGLMEGTFSELLGYRGGILYTIITQVDTVALVNIAVMVGCSAVLVALATLCVKPGGRKVKKRK